MALQFDPGDGHDFKAAIRQIPGYPAGEDLPIRTMLFEPGALFQVPALLESAGAVPNRPLLVVMDSTLMRREGAELKPLLLSHLRTAGWQPEPVWLEPDSGGQVHTDFSQIESVRTRLQPCAAVLSGRACTVTAIVLPC